MAGRRSTGTRRASTDRNYALPDSIGRHNFQLGFAYALPWQTKGGYDNVLSAIVNDWQVNGLLAAFSGTPFTVTASGTSLNTPSNTQTADLVGLVQRDRRHRRGRARGSIRPIRATDRRPLRQHGTEPVPWSRRLEPRLLRVPVVPDWRCEAARIPRSRRATCSTIRCTATRTGTSPPATSGESRASRTSIRSAEIQMGLRFSF